MPVIQKMVTKKQKLAWQSYCESEGLNQSEMLGLMLEKVTSSQFDPDFKGLRKRRSNRLFVAFSDSENEKITKKCRDEGFPSGSTWLRLLAISSVDNVSLLSQKQVDSLLDSTRKIERIGRNLNQIARGLNTEFRDTDKLKLDAITELSNELNKHLDIAYNMVDFTIDKKRPNE